MQLVNISDAESYEHLCDPGFVPKLEVQDTLLEVSAIAKIKMVFFHYTIMHALTKLD
jgi:hypothetical protein